MTTAGAAVRIVLGLALVGAVTLQIRGFGGRAGLSRTTPPPVTGPLDLADPDSLRQILPPRPSDLYHLREQRSLADELARRHAGASLRGGRLEDLRVLQTLVDRGVPKPEETYELQALGVVLGDVLAEQLDLEWVRVEDRYGEGRALQVDESETLIFPVTMISRRVEAGLEVQVAELYARARDVVAKAR